MCYPYTICKCTNNPEPCCNKSKTDNINYTGPNLPCTNIDTNDDMTLVIQKLNDAFCTTSTTSTTSSSTTIGLAIPLLRVASPCCGDVTEKVVDLMTLNSEGNTFTGDDGRPYTLTNSTPVLGAPNIFQSIVDSGIYSTCDQWASINGACPTTTTTTSFSCTTYSYLVQRYNCFSCVQIGATTTIINATQLTIGRFYQNSATSIVYRIVQFTGCSAGPANQTLLDTNQKNNCVQASCPTTTTTSTIPPTTTTTTTLAPTTTTTTTNYFISVYRVDASCCTPPDTTERLVDLPTLPGGGANAVFTALDNRPYKLISSVPIMGNPNVFQNAIDTFIYTGCSQWFTSNPSGCPTTTTTTSFTCGVSYSYSVTIFQCSNCNNLGPTTIFNAGPLTIGRYYYNAGNNLIYRVNSLLGCSGTPASIFLSDANQRNACSQAQVCNTTTTTTTIPTTTTTTTPSCVSYTYTFEQRTCGMCGNPPSTGTLNNDTYVTPGKWWPLAPGSVLRLVSFVGCTNAAHDIALLEANGKNTCGEVICGVF